MVRALRPSRVPHCAAGAPHTGQVAPRTAPPARRPAPARTGARRPAPPARRPVRRPPARANALDYPRAGRRTPWRWIPTLRLLLLVGLLGLIAVLGAAVIAYRAVDIPEEEASANYATSTVYFADDAQEMGDFAEIDRVPLEPDEIPDSVKYAVVAAEDRSFYDNRGISVTGLGRAVYGVLTNRDLGGGSTITQQYVKNIYGDDAPTYTRKAREAIIALKIDERDSKEEVLARYLNTIYFGRKAYGIETAAQAYFDKPAAQLSVPEAALLIGIIPAPSAWDPAVDPEMAQTRYEYVISSMVETGTLPAVEAAAVAQMPVTVEDADANTYAGPNGYVLQAVREELVAGGVSEEEIDQGGLRIVTTIDPEMQRAAVAAMEDPEVFPTRNRPATLQAGLVSIDPATGAVRAMYAGADGLTGQQSSITKATAQAGSTFKPFTLVAALEDGITLRETLDGRSPRTFEGYEDGEGNTVPVNNFGRRSAGTVNLVQATAGSVNTAYVELNAEVGPAATKEVAARAGLPEEAIPDGLSNVLGTASVRPVDLAEAYATFAAQGVHHDTHFVASATRISDGVARYTGADAGERVFSEGVMADATVALQAVVTSGSATRAERLGRPAAGKTGTSQNSKAAWFSGFTPQLATTVVLFNSADGSDPAVPVGTELEIPGFGGVAQVTGGSFPTAIWTRYMQEALGGTEELDFPPGTAPRPAPRRSSATTPRPSASQQPSRRATQEPAEPAPAPAPEPSSEPVPAPEPEPTQESPAPTPVETPSLEPAPAAAWAQGQTVPGPAVAGPAVAGQGGDAGRDGG